MTIKGNSITSTRKDLQASVTLFHCFFIVSILSQYKYEVKTQIPKIMVDIERELGIMLATMSQLFQLMYGKSKKRMKPIMIDVKSKCENYMSARSHSTRGWHEIVLAPAGAIQWRQKSATIGGNRPTTVVKTTGKNRSMAGYIDGHGFNAHT